MRGVNTNRFFFPFLGFVKVLNMHMCSGSIIMRSMDEINICRSGRTYVQASVLFKTDDIQVHCLKTDDKEVYCLKLMLCLQALMPT